MSELNNHPLILAYNKQNSFGKLLEMNFSILSPGIVVYSLNINHQHLATPTAVHGGVISSLMDAALGVGALSMVCTDDKVVSTVEMSVSFLNPAYLGDKLVAKSTVMKAGNRLIFMEAIIQNQHGSTIAKSSGIFNAYPKEKAGY